MRNIVLALVLAALVPTPQDGKQWDAWSSEDSKVLTAVIDHTIRPKVQKVTGQPSAVVFLLDHTAPACDRMREPRSQPLCMAGLVEGQPNAFDTGDFRPIFAEVVPSVTHRAELLASIRARNAARQVLPLSEGRDVKLVAAPPVIPTPSGDTLTIYTLFSLPGYSSAGHAAVTAFIDCAGGPAMEPWPSAPISGCGGVLTWLLEKRGADWQVRGRKQWVSHAVDLDFNKPAIYNTPTAK